MPHRCRFPSHPAFTLPDLNPFLTLEGGMVGGSVDCSDNSTRLKYDVCYNQVSLFSGEGMHLALRIHGTGRHIAGWLARSSGHRSSALGACLPFCPTVCLQAWRYTAPMMPA
jgi:hypothetical protein